MPLVEGNAVLMRMGIGLTLLTIEKKKVELFPCQARAQTILSHPPQL